MPELTWLAIYTTAEWAIRLAMLAVILRKRLPAATALAWLAIVFFLPVAGLALYLLLGDARLGRRRAKERRRRITEIRRGCRERAGQLEPDQPVELPDDDAMLMRQAESVCGLPIAGGNSVELLDNTDPTIARMIEDIDAAEHHVHMLFYIFEPDDVGRRVCDALIRAAKRGLEVRLLMDAAGSRRMFSGRGFVAQLEAAGVSVRSCLPVKLLRKRLSRLDMRNHRKLVVIDGRVGFAGSHNVVDPTYHKHAGRWIDLNARLTGPIVAQLQLTFLEDWEFESGQRPEAPSLYPTLDPAGDVAAQCVPTGPGEDSESLHRVLLAAINSAQRRLIITTPYFVPSESTLLALTMAADRGVDVDMVLPDKSDHPLVDAAGRANYQALLEAGVKLHAFGAGLLHSKTMTVDDTLAMLGSSNLDVRSFYLNFELTVLLYGQQITREMRRVQHRYLAQSSPIDPQRWARRAVLARYRDNAAALLSPLL